MLENAIMEYVLPSPFKLMYEPVMDSTNRLLRQHCEDGLLDEYLVAVTDYQTAGRGQRGNTWESEEGKNLMFSVLLTPSFLHASNQFLISQIASLAIKDVLDLYCDDITVKWPNDIYWRDKKICGMLIEHGLQGQNLSWTVIGIGLNINQKAFVSPAPNPVSLSQITACEHPLPKLLSQILDRLAFYYNRLKQNHTEGIAETYFKALFRKETPALYRDAAGEFSARIVRVEPSGLLVLELAGGEEKAYAFKEIAYVL